MPLLLSMDFSHLHLKKKNRSFCLSPYAHLNFQLDYTMDFLFVFQNVLNSLKSCIKKTSIRNSFLNLISDAHFNSQNLFN